MKKIFFSLVALAAIAACSKSEVEYTDNMELSFAPITQLNAKAAVDGTDYPDGLNMFIFANAGEATATVPTGYTEPYLRNAEFTHRESLTTHVFGGITPYYWPNVKKLIFSGYSKSGNVSTINPTYVQDGSTWVIKMEGYAPGKGTAATESNPAGNNDLMWFPTTTESYGKPATANTPIPVVMQHACAWVTIKIKGDNVTGATGTTWKIKNISFTDLSQSGNVTLGDTASWTSVATGATFNVFNRTASTDYKPLTTNFVDYTQIDFADLVIVPQSTKTLYITYEFVPQENVAAITETKPLELTYTGGTGWEAGKHYTYNITIGTSEILIHPELTDWVDVPSNGTDKEI